MSTELFAQISSVNPLWDSGLQYGPGFRLCKKAYRTDTDAVGVVGPLPGEAVGWLVHPALADSMLHLTAVAPKPPEGGWPWMSEDERESRYRGWQRAVERSRGWAEEGA